MEAIQTLSQVKVSDDTLRWWWVGKHSQEARQVWRKAFSDYGGIEANFTGPDEDGLTWRRRRSNWATKISGQHEQEMAFGDEDDMRNKATKQDKLREGVIDEDNIVIAESQNQALLDEDHAIGRSVSIVSKLFQYIN